MHRPIHRPVFLISLGLLLGLTGCASDTMGPATLTDASVKQIHKGMTTRQDLERMFGPPQMASMMGGGKRALHYRYTERNTQLNAATYIPIAGAFLGAANSQVHMRTLQVILAANGTVEDYEYNESTTDMSRGGYLNSTSESTVSGKSESPPP